MTFENYFRAFPAIFAAFIVFNVNFSSGQLTAEEMTVNAGDLGLILGKRQETRPPHRVEHMEFLGIPFAKPMLAENRFLPSTLLKGPLESEDGIFQATTYGISCMQPNQLTTIPQDENCLFINIWTRRVNNDTENPMLRPVIFFVHGGAFTIGSGSTFTGLRILNRDVVYVTFNYRLGSLGFFSLDNADAPGNAGMYDIITALDWVHNYIQFFGGDRNSITIGGQSAGSAAVTALMVSPLAIGKFHKVIAASGTVLNAWASTTEGKKGSLEIAKICGCYDLDDPEHDEDTEVLSCMKTANATTLVNALFQYQVGERNEGRLGFEPVSPSIQTFDTTGSEIKKIFPEMPARVFEEGRQADVPLLIGTTRHDGTYAMGVNYNRYLKPNNLTQDPDFLRSDLVPVLLKALGINDDSFGIYESLARIYLGDTRFTGDFDLMLPGLMDLHNVFFYKAAAYGMALLHSQKNGNTFYYSFDYKGTQTLWLILFNIRDVPYFRGGITHTDDMIYLMPLLVAQHNPQEREVANRMLDYWANFAEFGNPTPVDTTPEDEPIWPQLTKVNSKYLSINAKSFVLENYPDAWVNASLEIFPHLIPTEPPQTTPPPTTTETTTTEEAVTTEERVTTEETVTTEEMVTTEETTTTEQPTTTEEPVTTDSSDLESTTSAAVNRVYLSSFPLFLALCSIINLV